MEKFQGLEVVFTGTSKGWKFCAPPALNSRAAI